MSKELFDEVVGAPPPSTVDVRAIVRRRRRVIAVRRLGLGVTAVVVAAVASLTTLAVGGGPGVPDEVVPGVTATEGGTSVDLDPGQLREALARAVAARVPDARWRPDGQAPVIEQQSPPGVLCGEPGGCGQEDPIVSPAAPEGPSGHRDLERPGIVGVVSMAVKADQAALVCTESPTMTCVAGVASTGGRMATMTSAQIAGGPVTLRTVVLELPGARTLELSASAYTIGGDGGDPAAGTVLTEAELVDIATDIFRRIVR